MISIYTSGDNFLEPPEERETLTFEEAQKIVEGWVEVVRMPSARAVFLVNEEGLLKGLEPNVRASWIAGRPLVGNAVWLSDESIKAVLHTGDDDDE